MRRPSLVILPLLAASALLLPACGSSSSSSSGSGTTDPATAVPPGALVYGSAVIRPQGSQKADVDAAARKVLNGGDPGQKISSLLDGQLRKAGLTYAKDVKPWLGQKAAFFLTSVSTGSASGALLLDSKDDGAAQSAFDRGFKHEGKSVTKTSFDGVDIRSTASDNAVAVDKGLVMAGTRSGVRNAIAARKGASLAKAAVYTNATSKVSRNGIALFYVNAPALLNAVAASSPSAAAALQALHDVPQLHNLHPIAAAVTVSGDAIAIEAPATRAATSSRPLSALPASAWLGFSAGHIGRSIRNSLASLRALPQGAAIVGQLQNQLAAQTGLNLQRDLLSWLTDASVYIAGPPASFAAGLSIGSSDPAASQRAVQRIGRALQSRGGLPAKPGPHGFKIRSSRGDVAILSTKSGVVAALGHNALALTQHPSSTLGSDPTFQSALKAMGDGAQPVLYLSLPTALEYAAAGGSASDPSFQSAQPYLRHFSYVAYGTARRGAGNIARLVIGLK